MAGVLFVLPGVVSIMALSIVYALFGKVGIVSALFFGLKAAVLAVVLQAVVRIGGKALKNRVMVALAATAFVAIFFFGVPFPIIVLTAGVIGFFGGRAGVSAFQVGERPRRGRGRQRGAPTHEALLGEELPDHARPDGGAGTARLRRLPCAVARSGRGIARDAGHRQRVQPDRNLLLDDGGRHLRRRLCGAGLRRPAGGRELWLACGRARCWTASAWRRRRPDRSSWSSSSSASWERIRDPGSLSPLLAGTLGGLLATWVTFVPCFLFIFLGAPFIEVLRGNRALHGALSAITAAVVGVVLNLAIWFAIHTVFPRNSAGASLLVLLRRARARKRRPVGAAALGGGLARDVPVQGRHDPNARGVLGGGDPPLSCGDDFMSWLACEHVAAGALRILPMAASAQTMTFADCSGRVTPEGLRFRPHRSGQAGAMGGRRGQDGD